LPGYPIVSFLKSQQIRILVCHSHMNRSAIDHSVQYVFYCLIIPPASDATTGIAHRHCFQATFASPSSRSAGKIYLFVRTMRHFRFCFFFRPVLRVQLKPKYECEEAALRVWARRRYCPTTVRNLFFNSRIARRPTTNLSGKPFCRPEKM
jgi:hypothetical protein